MTASKDPAKAPDKDAQRPLTDLPAYSPGDDWSTAAAGADKVFGHDLAKNELLDALVGVPFLIHRLTYRAGAMRGTPPVRADYVSVECVIAPEAELRRRRVNLDTLPFGPEDTVVFNDGSTGIYRQLVVYLSEKGFISLPDGKTEGGLGETVYDLPAAKWAGIHAGVATDNDGHTDYAVNVRLFCPRGIRRSEYPNAYVPGEDAVTRYLG